MHKTFPLLDGHSPRLAELEGLLEELEAVKRSEVVSKLLDCRMRLYGKLWNDKSLQVIAKIAERRKKKKEEEEERHCINDMTDVGKNNDEYNIDDALMFIEGRVHRKKKANVENSKKRNSQPKKTKKKQKSKKEKFKEAALLVEEEALSLEETIEVNKGDGLENSCSKVERKNRRKTPKVNRKREKSDVAMFDEIVGDLINELDIFEITQIEGHSDEEIEISARATVETIKNLEFDKNDQWTKVTTVNKKKKRKPKKEVKVDNQSFTIIDVEHKRKEPSSKFRGTEDFQSRKIWMETNDVFLKNCENRLLSEDDFPRLVKIGKSLAPELEELCPVEPVEEKEKVVKETFGKGCEKVHEVGGEELLLLDWEELEETSLDEMVISQPGSQEDLVFADQDGGKEEGIRAAEDLEPNRRKDQSLDLAKKFHQIQEDSVSEGTLDWEDLTEEQDNVEDEDSFSSVLDQENKKGVDKIDNQVFMTRIEAMLRGFPVHMGSL